jgi:hypothetical protein
MTVSKRVTVRFYLAEKAPGTFNWPSDRLRSIMASNLPNVGADGKDAATSSGSLLVEQGAASTSMTHAQVSADMDEMPAVREGPHTEVLTLNRNQVPAMTTHVVFLPAGVVAVVRPGITAPAARISASAISIATGVPIWLIPLIRSDQLTVLNNAGGVSTAEFTVVDIDPAIAEQDDVLDAANRLLGVAGIQATVKLVAHSRAERASLRARLLEWMRWRNDGRLRFDRARAKLSERPQGAATKAFVDLLEDEITESITVQLPQTGPAATLRAAEVLTAVEEAYKRLDVVIGAALAEIVSQFAADR